MEGVELSDMASADRSCCWVVQEGNQEDYSKSTIVQTSAPTEMGSLRKADGQEGFGGKKVAVNGNGIHA